MRLRHGYPSGERVERLVRDSGVCGLRVTSGPNRGKRIRGRSSTTASCPELLCPFRDEMRPGRREHP
eukprot:6265206-Alexandrium_andersonii.AAC.1